MNDVHSSLLHCDSFARAGPNAKTDRFKDSPQMAGTKSDALLPLILDKAPKREL